VAGELVIIPDNDTMTEIHRHANDSAIAVFHVCIAETGEPQSVELVRASCFPRWELEIAHTVMNTWRYAPFTSNGAPQPVCTHVTFAYAQR
jgi:hypothetical protein